MWKSVIIDSGMFRIYIPYMSTKYRPAWYANKKNKKWKYEKLYWLNWLFYFVLYMNSKYYSSSARGPKKVVFAVTRALMTGSSEIKTPVKLVRKLLSLVPYFRWSSYE